MTIKEVMWTRGDGTVIDKLRLTADEGMVLTRDGSELWHCVEVDNAEGWYEVDAPEEEADPNTPEAAVE